MTEHGESTGAPSASSWKRLTKDEKDHLRKITKKPVDPAFQRLASSCDSQTLVLAVLGDLSASLTIAEIAYLIAARYGANADAAVVARQIGKAIRDHLVRETPGRRYALTPAGRDRVASAVG